VADQKPISDYLGCAVFVLENKPTKATYQELQKQAREKIYMNDKVSDMITRIRNAYLAHKAEVLMPSTKLLASIAKVLVEEKYLKSSELLESPKPTLKLVLNYAGNMAAVSKLRRVSKPGSRIYKKGRELKPILSGMGIAILSTSKGIMTDRTARREKIGGEVLTELL